MASTSNPLKGYKAGEPITHTTLEKLTKTWMETYLALMLIMSKKENKPLEQMKYKLVEANEAVMDFFDKGEESVDKNF